MLVVQVKNEKKEEEKPVFGISRWSYYEIED